MRAVVHVQGAAFLVMLFAPVPVSMRVSVCEQFLFDARSSFVLHLTLCARARLRCIMMRIEFEYDLNNIRTPFEYHSNDIRIVFEHRSNTV